MGVWNCHHTGNGAMSCCQSSVALLRDGVGDVAQVVECWLTNAVWSPVCWVCNSVWCLGVGAGAVRWPVCDTCMRNGRTMPHPQLTPSRWWWACRLRMRQRVDGEQRPIGINSHV